MQSSGHFSIGDHQQTDMTEGHDRKGLAGKSRFPSDFELVSV